MPEHHWPALRPPHELGAVAHGPVVLARASGIVAGLRCVFAHPGGLHLPLVLRASGERVRGASSWSYGRLRRYPGSFEGREDSEDRYLTYSAPELVVGVGGSRGPADTAGAVHAGDGDEVWAMDASYWIGELPRDGRLHLTISWPRAGLPQTSTELVLDLADLPRRVLPLL